MRQIILALLAITLWTACSGRNKPINRSVDSYFDKAQFNPNWESSLLSPEWYYRMTVIDAPPGSKALSVGDGNWLHAESIRFEITEFHLIGWRSHASVPGSDRDLSPGAQENYKGAPVVAFKIINHFDLAPNYDPMTSARGNLLVENKTDRSWYKRRFIKVDFSKNLAQDLNRHDEASWMWGSPNIGLENSFAIGQNEPANPKRSRFEDGYFDVTTRQGVKADIMGYYGGYGDPFQMDSSAPVFDIRYSFLKKPEKTNYKPLNYTDDLFDQFGFYRTSFTGQQKWDPYRGSLESQKNYNVTRFNIWNEDGSPKPIVYYTSVSHPKNLMKASRRVESEWNRLFKELVFEMKKGTYTSVSDVPDMWVLRENACNIENVSKLLSEDLKNKVEESAGVRLANVQERLNAANDLTNKRSFSENHAKEAAALDDLEKICAAFEYYTQGKETAFSYQRAGDLRYNLLNLINKRLMTNWSGLGPMFADMQTGEIIQSTANVNLWYLDRRAQQAADHMDMMTGNTRFRDLIFGNDVHSYMAQKTSQIQKDQMKMPDAASLTTLNNKFALQSGKIDTLPAADVDIRLNAINDTMFLPKIYVEQINPIRDFEAKQRRLHEQALGISDPPEFLDNLVVGSALQFLKADPKERFLKIREAVYIATMLHEVGHNMGLTHNMSGSADPLNYAPEFWEYQKLPPNPIEALKVVKSDSDIASKLAKCAKDSAATWKMLVSTQDCLRQSEYMYSSIMDYHASWNADLAGLGAYDKAAIFFGYGQLVETFNPGQLTTLAKDKGLSRWLFLNDWRKIPGGFVGDADQIHDRNWISYEKADPKARVPYRFCLDSSGWYGPHCRAFDFGADMRSRAARNRTLYWGHYFLTHFARDRIWTMGNDLSSVVGQDLAVFDDFNQIMRWYGFYALTDPEFRDSDAGKDYLAATVTGLNHYSHVLGHPVSGEHVTTLEDNKVLRAVDQLDNCALDNVTNKNAKDERTAIENHRYTTVYLGDGRPFAFGLNSDYEDYHLNFVGSFHAKLAAGYYLAYPGGLFPRVDGMKDERLFRMNWYRIFPEEIADLFSKLIRSQWDELGPLIDEDGELMHRDILDPVTLRRPDYTGLMAIMPASADMLPYRSLYYASALLSIPQLTEFNPIHSLQIGLEGGSDDRKSAYASALSDDVAVFENPSDGRRYWAKKAGKSPIAYDYVVKLGVLKDKVKAVETCLADVEFRKKAPECVCFDTMVNGECCAPGNTACPAAKPRPCNNEELNKKLTQQRIDMENAVGFADDMRFIVKRYTMLN
ncbi:MAG: hypothetical protein V4534_06210 [Myxococcota bacterium]